MFYIECDHKFSFFHCFLECLLLFRYLTAKLLACCLQLSLTTNINYVHLINVYNNPLFLKLCFKYCLSTFSVSLKTVISAIEHSESILIKLYIQVNYIVLFNHKINCLMFHMLSLYQTDKNFDSFKHKICFHSLNCLVYLFSYNCEVLKLNCLVYLFSNNCEVVSLLPTVATNFDNVHLMNYPLICFPIWFVYVTMNVCYLKLFVNLKTMCEIRIIMKVICQKCVNSIIVYCHKKFIEMP